MRAIFLLILIAVTLRPSSADPNAGLIARYGFEMLDNGRIVDLSGKGNDLLAQGKLSLAPGKVGRAVVISKEGYPQAAFSPSLELGGEMTLEAWIKPDFNPPSGMRILDRATIGGSDGFMLDTWPAGQLRLITSSGRLQDTEPVPVGQWTHVAVTQSLDEGVARLYRNGQVVAEGTTAGKLNPSQWPLNVGASQGGGDRFSGLLDEVRIYNRALAPEEIMAHFEGREIEPPTPVKTLLAPLPAFVKDDTAQVDHAAQCARNDLVYRGPAAYPFEAMRLGNGNLGVTMWNEGGLTWQVNNGSWRVGNEPLSSGRVMLSTPALSQEKPAVFEQRLRLWDGTVTTGLSGSGGEAQATAFAVEGQDALVFRCNETGNGPRTLTLRLWRPTARFVCGKKFIAVTEAAEHKEEFLATAMCLLVAVDGGQVETEKVDEQTLRLTFGGGPGEYMVYLCNPLVRGTEKLALQRAQEMLERLRETGYETLLAQCQAYWHKFWPQSFIHLTSRSGEAELLENLWYLFLHDLASMSRDTLCPKFNGGNWLTWDDLRHWAGGYWHQNTREIFWPAYGAGHVDLTEPFFELYGRAAKVARESGRGMGVDGYYIPEWVPIAPVAQGKREIKPPGGYTAYIFTVAAEVALQSMWRYEFTGDEKWLREYAYPLLKGALNFYLSYAKKGADGQYHIESADAQESYWLVKDPAQDLAALRWGLPLAIRLGEKLKVDAELRPRWRDLLDNLAPFPVDPEKNMIREADLKPTDERHNSENVANYAIYPFGVFGIGKPDWQLAKNTFDNRPVQGMGNGWEPAAVVAARLGLGEEASKLLLAHMQTNMRGSAAMWYSPTTTVYPGGQPDSPYCDTSGTDAQTLQEMLLQSHDGVIRLAPAWPERWQAQYRLHARGGFVVTADVEQGQLRYALIESQRGGECVVANPWKGTAVVTAGGKAIVTSDKTELRFVTSPGRTYRLEPAAMPLAKLPFAELAPQAAEGAKWIGKLPLYPKWTSSAYLGIDDRGRTPARAWMLRAVEGFARQLAEATVGLEDLTTGKVTASIIGSDGKAEPTPRLTDGEFGGRVSIPVQNEGYVVLDLGQARRVGAVAWSGDRTALFIAQPTAGFTIETSLDAQAWQMVKNGEKSGKPATGHVESFGPAEARYVRLRLWGQYQRPVLLDEVAVHGK